MLNPTSPIHLACVYLPPFSKDGGSDSEWHAELDGLHGDLSTLFGMNASAHFLMVGDWNVQPISISHTIDRAQLRGVAIERFYARWEGVLLNPNVQHDTTVRITVPLRKKPVDIHPGSTHSARHAI